MANNIISSGKRLFFEGAMGTLLQGKGIPDGVIPDVWSITHPEIITEIHKSYISAGCNIIKSNTFGSNRLKLERYGYSVDEAVAAAFSCADKAISDTRATDVVRALDIGPTGKLLAPMGDLQFEDAIDVYSETIKAGVKNGADCILIETMTDTYELKAAVVAAKEHSSLPIFCTFTLDNNGKLLTGASIETVVTLLEGLGVYAIGVNCGFGPERAADFIRRISEISSLPLIINPNAGLPTYDGGHTHFDTSPDTFAEQMREIAPLTRFMGGCCGTTPEHIKRTIELCRDIPLAPKEDKNTLRICSGTRTVEFSDVPTIIGERINPTGKPSLKQALRDGDTSYILREALSQQKAGSDVLDVNVGLPDTDEPTVLPRTVAAIQEISDLPLQIDTSNFTAMEQAVRIYNGKPLINSVCGKEESMSTVFPIAKKYGGAVIALTLDEDGIPDTAEGRFKIAERIVRRASEYGIDKKELIIDVLTLPVSTNEHAASTTLEALRMVKTLGVRTALGVSNVSFGLPARKELNSFFFALAMQAGLDAAIVNPCCHATMAAYHSYCLLSGNDTGCREYVAAASDEPEVRNDAGGADKLSLYDAVLHGMRTEAAALTRELLKERAPIEITDSILIPALGAVGEGFERGTLFLPQLLMSADAAKDAFDEINRAIKDTAGGDTDGRNIVIATVKGDIHDIGKNIVRVLLENYRFSVVDLGKDVDPEVILRAVREHDAKICALSALMTTTLPAMEDAVRLLRREVPDCRIMVGGAVLTKEYSDSIGADFYAKDAMSAVRYAQSVFD